MAQYSEQHSSILLCQGEFPHRGICLIMVLWTHCTYNPNNSMHYDLTGNRYQKMTCKGERPCRSLPPNQNCLTDQGYDFFSQKMRERIKWTKMDLVPLSLLRGWEWRQANWWKKPQIGSRSTLWREKCTLETKERGSSNFGDREKELHCPSTLLTFGSKGPLLSSLSNTSIKYSGSSTLYCQSTPDCFRPCFSRGSSTSFPLSPVKRVDSD